MAITIALAGNPNCGNKREQKQTQFVFCRAGASPVQPKMRISECNVKFI